MSNFPNAPDSFPQHADNVRETIAAAHANNIQDAIVAIETTLGTGVAGAAGTVKDRLAAIESNLAALNANQGFSLPVANSTTRGIVRLAGDLSGTADAPRLTQLPNLAQISYVDNFHKVKDLGNVSGTVQLDLTQGTHFTMTLTGNVTLTVVGWVTKPLDQHVIVKAVQDSTGGRTITWPTRFAKAQTVTSLASTAAGSYTLYEFSSPDIGSSVSLWCNGSFNAPVSGDRYDNAVLGLGGLSYYLPLEETSSSSTTTIAGVSKVLIFIAENHHYNQTRGNMPNLDALANTYGYANNFKAIIHPSLGNYMALAFGDSYGITDDNNPPSHNTSNQTIFGQAIAAGKTAKTYAETMPSNNYQSDSGNYSAHHNPWIYASAEQAQANLYDVPQGTTSSGALITDINNNTLPNVGLVVPNQINNAHDGTLSQADAYVNAWIPLVMATPDWQSGKLAIIYTWDEDDDTGGDNRVYTVVIQKGVKNKVVSTALNLYSITKFVGDMLGVTPLRKGATAADMAAAFGISFVPTTVPGGTAPAADASGQNVTGTYNGTFTWANTLTVPTSTKKSPDFLAANTNWVSNDGVHPGCATAAWSLGFTIKATDPGLSAQEVIYSETLSTDNTSGQGFYIQSGTTTISGSKTGAVMKLVNAAGSNIFTKTLSTYLFDGVAHDVVVSFDGGNIYTVYVDGVVSDTVVQAPSAVTVDRATWGARRRVSTDRYFTGSLGRLWVRAGATSATEVNALYTAFNNGAGTGGGSGGNGGNPPPPIAYDSNGVKLNVPTVTVNNSQINVSAVIDRNQTVAFQYLQIAVRPPAGSGGTAFSTAYTPGTVTGSGTQTISGTGTCDVDGDWTAFATYSLVSSPVQADWIDGTPVTFTIGTVAPPDPGGGNGGGGGVPTTSTVLLGMSGAGAADGSQGNWIGRALDMGGTWNDVDAANQTNVYSIQPGQEWGSWTKPLDLAVGGIFGGESWTQAANGNFDARWRQCLTNVKNYWGNRDFSKLYLRFAHEFNGDWFWPVHGSEADKFVTAWRRFRSIQKEVVPGLNLVWCVNDGTSSSLGLNLLDSFPGSSYVDVYGVDSYNWWPWEDGTSTSAFNNYMNAGIGTRTPTGPEAHRQAALAYGLPIGFGEWGNIGSDSGGSGGGDAPAWIDKMFDWFFAHQGSGPGNVLYAVYFNIGARFQVNPAPQMPNSATRFKARMLSRT